MSHHEEIPEDIRKQLKDFQKKLSTLQSFKGSARDQAIIKNQNHAKRIRRLMDTYQCSIQSGAFENTISSHKSQYKEFQLEITRLQKSLDANRLDVGTEQELFRHKPKTVKNVQSKNNRQLVVEAGNKAQKQSKDALGRIIRDVNEMDEKANIIMTELDRQIQLLDKVYDELNDTESTLKRAQTHLKYFARQVYTDRCLVFIIILIALAILVIIGLSIAGKTPKQQKSTVG